MGRFRIRLLRQLATGHSTDVWLGERAERLSERLIVKLLRSADDEPLLWREQEALRALECSSRKGADLFSTWLPQRVDIGLSVANAGRLTAVFRQPVGFSHTFGDLCQVYPTGVDPRHLIWLWRRMLELLGWVHRAGMNPAFLVLGHG